MSLERVLIQFNEKYRSDLERQVADIPSPSPHTEEMPKQLVRNIFGAEQAIRVIFLTTFRPVWETDKLIRTIGQKAYQYSYQGTWMKVQEYLETYQADPQWFIEKYLETHSTNDLFGNFLRQSLKEAKLVQYKRQLFVDEDFRKVHRRIRRRGYDDKGTLRLPHERHGEDIPRKEKEDRRGLSNHPLVKEIAGGEYGTDSRPSKGDEFYEQSSRRESLENSTFSRRLQGLRENVREGLWAVGQDP